MIKEKNNRKKQKQNAKDEFNELHFIWKLIFCCIFVLGACVFFNRHIKLCLQIIDAFTDDIVHKKLVI